MPAPGIVIDESDVGVRPVTAAVLNRIGMVGHHNWGPQSVPTLVQSKRELDQQFGPTWETGLTGMLSGAAIYAQNAAAGVYVVRIAPTTPGVKATQTFSSKVAITALHYGTGGNDIAVVIANGTSTGKKYTVSSAILDITEVWDNQTNTNSTTTTFAAAGGPNEVGAGSALVSFAWAADGDPSNAASALLSAGTPGTNGTPAVADYVGAVTGSARSGLYALDGVRDVRYVLCAQQSHATVTTGLQTYVASRGVGAGLVMGLVNTPAATAPSDVSTGSLDSMRLGTYWPWLLSSAVPAAAQASAVAPDGFIAGLLSTLPANQSPLNKLIQGVTDLQYHASDAQVDTLAALRVNAITTSRGRGVRARNGATLSSDAAWSFWEVRAEYDTVETTLWDAYAWVVGEPNIPSRLWPDVEAQGDTVLDLAAQDGTIVAHRPTKVVNTAADTAAGRLIVEHAIQFTVGARYVTLKISRSLDAAA